MNVRALPEQMGLLLDKVRVGIEFTVTVTGKREADTQPLLVTSA